MDVCVATPGRLLEFVRDGAIQLRRCTFVVLDEADRMLELGYDGQLKSIIGQLRVSAFYRQDRSARSPFVSP